MREWKRKNGTGSKVLAFCSGGEREFDFRPMRYVFAAAEHLSIRAAADALDVEPSSVSRAIRDVEERMGTGLFERGGFGVRLTDAGRRFVEQTRPAFRQIERALEDLAAAGRVETGILRIGVITTLAGGFLRELVTRYEAAYPGVMLEIRDGGRQDHIGAIRSRVLDAAFLTGNAAVAGCDTVEFWRERVYIAMPRTHPLAKRDGVEWAELKDEQFIVSGFEPGPEVRDYIVRRIANYSTYPSIEYHPVHQETLMHRVAMGKGITAVSEAWTDVIIPDLALVPLRADEDIVPFSAVWSPEADNPSLRRLISFARNLARKTRSDPA